MSAYSLIRRAALDLEQNGTRESRVAARHLHQLANKLERKAILDRDLKRRKRGTKADRRGRPIAQSGAAAPDSAAATRRPGERWTAVAGDHESTVQLRKVGKRKRD